jgi:prevent-host-death family protein
MPEIGIRELKTRASEILRNVRKRGVRYMITYRGRPVGLLIPVEQPELGTSEEATLSLAAWNELTKLGREIGRRWPKGLRSAQVLSKMRR